MIVKISDKKVNSYFYVVNRFPNLARPWYSLTAYFSESMKDRDVKFGHNFDSGLTIMLLKFGIDIFDSLETMRFSAT